MVREIFSEFFGEIVVTAFTFVALWAHLWLPPVLLYILWQMWVRYVRARKLLETDFVVIEVRIPKEVVRSPQAMELFLTGLFQTGGEKTFIMRYWKGQTRPWFSLELVSIGGTIHFFIWTQKFWKSHIESQLYAQYPDAEVFEVPDYTKEVLTHKEEVSLWGADFVLTEKDAYPIKTYIDYGLDKDPKEELKNDPITAVLEYLGSLGPGEQVWIQFLIRAHKKEYKKPGTWFGKTDYWKDQVQDEIKDIVGKAQLKPDDENKPTKLNLTKGQEETIAALERSLSKYGFDIGIRGLYLADEDKFNPVRIPGLAGSFKQYNYGGLNGFKPTNTTSFDYPWQDFKGMRLAKKKREMFDAYRRRSWFFPPYKQKHYVLNTEEIATIYHFPGQIVTTPTFKRIESKKSEPPQNLPI